MTEEGWNFVIEHKSIIRYYCMGLQQGTSLDLDDLVQQSFVNIATSFATFDKDRGTPKTFIWWRCRLTKRNALRRSYKMNTTNIETIKNVIDQSVDANSIENNASISILLSKLEKKDRLACESFLQDLSKEEIKEKLGISYASRNMRIYRLRGKINE
jgi:RNA polymerase sigma factor (sigma-70 family)